MNSSSRTSFNFLPGVNLNHEFILSMRACKMRRVLETVTICSDLPPFPSVLKGMFWGGSFLGKVFKLGAARVLMTFIMSCYKLIFIDFPIGGLKDNR